MANKKSEIYRGPADDYFHGTEDKAFNRGGFPFAASPSVSAEGRSASSGKNAFEAFSGNPNPRQLGQRAAGKRELTAAERRAAAGRELVGGPRPRPPEHGDVQPKAAPTAPPKGLGAPYSTDDGVAGNFDVDRAGFEAISGSNPTPRHKLPAEPSETQGPFPAPLD